MLSLLDIIIESVCVALLLFWLFLFIKGAKYNEIIEPLNEKDFMLHELYGVGFAFMDLIKYKYKSKSDIKLRGEIEILYDGPKYAEYYLRVIYAKKITISSIVLLLGFIMYGLTGGELAIVILFVALAGFCYYYYGTSTKRMILSRSEQLMSEFANVVSKLALMTNAGMSLHEAWREVADSGDGVVYKEMKKAVSDMDNGISEIEALRRFGLRCVLPEIKKFISTITQGLTKGNAELVMELQNQSKEIWMLKRQDVKRQGELAANKLMFPIVLMFIGILIMVIVPIFANLGV